MNGLKRARSARSTFFTQYSIIDVSLPAIRRAQLAGSSVQVSGFKFFSYFPHMSRLEWVLSHCELWLFGLLGKLVFDYCNSGF
jgi:hypothetical protein